MQRESELEGSARLLAYLKRVTDRPALHYAEEPRFVGEGFEARVFGFRLSGAPDWESGPLVVRVPRSSVGGEALRRECVVQNTLAAMGYPAPRVLIAETDTKSLGQAFIVAQRLAGERLDQTSAQRPGIPAVLRALLTPLDLRLRIIGIWAETQVQLHDLPSEPLAQALDAAGLSSAELSFDTKLAGMEKLIAADRLHGLEPGLRWLHACRPPEPGSLAVCHGDLHLSNILVVGDRLSGVLDWSAATIADPALDLAATLTRIATAPVQVPAPIAPVLELCRREFAQAYLRAYARRRAINRTAVRYYRVFSCLHRLAWFGHLIRLGDPALGGQPIFTDAPRLIADIGSLAGVAVALPATEPRPELAPVDLAAVGKLA